MVTTSAFIIFLKSFHTSAATYALLERAGTYKVQVALSTPEKTYDCGYRSTGVVPYTLIEVKPLQPEKASPPIAITDAGMPTEVKPLQL